MTFDRLYPNAYLLQHVLPSIYRSDHFEACWCCGADTAFITYRFIRPAVPVCSITCIEKLDIIAKEVPCPEES